MRNAESKKLQPEALFCVIAGHIAIVLLFFFVGFLGTERFEYDRTVQDQPFDLSINGEEMKEVKLDGLTFPALPAGSEIRYSTKLHGATSHPLLRISRDHKL